MSQIFPRHFDLVFRLGLVGVVLFAAGLLVIWRLAIAQPLHAPIEQTVPFSHKHHVGDLGLDCRFCHAGVETQAYAGMPSTQVCMNCHSQLYTDVALLEPVRRSQQQGQPLLWHKVNTLPDFVYFNHSIHIGKGVGCVSCHGDVSGKPLLAQEAPLTMRWCLDCHRHPEPAMLPASQVFSPHARPLPGAEAVALAQSRHLRSAAQLSDCSTCHR